MKHSTLLLPMVLATVALPGALAAQRAAADSAAHADSLRQRALELQADPQTFYDAAIAYKDAAGYRGRTDITAVGDLVLAGRLLHASGQSAEALATLEAAAERALSLGDVERAAGAYLDAAWLAETLGEADEVQRLGAHAEMLASSPLLDDAQRRNILRRFYRTSNEGAAQADLSRADSLHEAALRAQADPSGRESAGRLLVEEASLRPAGDRSAVDALILAANLFYAADLPIRAREVLEDAAERAAAAGDIVRGARAYLDAATVAQLEGDESAARSLVEKAEGLAESPLLSEQERNRIRARVTRVSN